MQEDDIYTNFLDITTTIIGAGLAWFAGTSIRNRWPSKNGSRLKLRHSILDYSRKGCVNEWCKKQLEESAGKIHKPENEKRGVSVEA